MIRERKIDYIKGVGILFVLLGHVPEIPIELRKLIYSFHMPLFYVIFGYNFNFENLKETKINYFIKMIRKYLFPYFKFAIFFLIIYSLLLNLVRVLVLHEISFLELYYDLLKKIIGIVWSRGTTEWLPNSSPLWFLTSIYSISLILYYIYDKNKKLNLKRAILVILIGIFFSYLKPLLYLSHSTLFETLPLNFDTAMIGSIFAIIGVKLKNIKSLNVKRKEIILGIIFFIITTYYNGNVGYDGNNYHNFILTILSGLLGSLLCFKFGEYLDKYYSIKILEILGKNTLYLMAYDYTLNFILNRFNIKFWIIYFSIKIFLALILIVIKYKNFDKIIGRKIK